MPDTCTGPRCPSKPAEAGTAHRCETGSASLCFGEQAEAGVLAVEEGQPVAVAPAKRPKHNTWGLGQVRYCFHWSQTALLGPGRCQSLVCKNSTQHADLCTLSDGGRRLRQPGGAGIRAAVEGGQ